MQISSSSSRKKLRRYIQAALTGATFGATLLAVPAFANTYPVTTTADSGSGSLRQAIIDANTNPGSDNVVISEDLIDESGPSLSFVLNSALPALADGTTVTLGDDEVHVTVPSALLANGDGNNTGPGNAGTFVITNGTITGSVTSNGGTTWDTRAEIKLQDSTATGDITTNDHGHIHLYGTSITGNAFANDDSAIGIHDSSTIHGNATVTGEARFFAYDDSTVTGNLTAEDDAYAEIEDSYIGGNVTSNGISTQGDGGEEYPEIDIYDSTIGTVNGDSLQSGTGNVSAINGGVVYVGETSVLGNVISDGNGSEVYIDDDSEIGFVNEAGVLQSGTGDLKATDGGYISMGESPRTVFGNVIADGLCSEIDLNDVSIGTVNDDGVLQAGTGDIKATNAGNVYVINSLIRGNVTADGGDPDAYDGEGAGSYISIENSTIGSLNEEGVLQSGTGNVTATNGAEIEVFGDGYGDGYGYCDVDQTNILGNVLADGGYFNSDYQEFYRSEVDINQATIGTVNEEGQLQAGTGNVTATGGGVVYVQGNENVDATILGNVTADGGVFTTYTDDDDQETEFHRSKVIIDDETVGTLDESGELQTDTNNNTTGNVSATNGGIVVIKDGSHILGNVNVDGGADSASLGFLRSKVIIKDDSTIGTFDEGVLQTDSAGNPTGNLSVTNGGFVYMDWSQVGGNATFSGNSKGSIENSWIGSPAGEGEGAQENTGDLTLNDSSYVSLDGNNSVWGNITANNNSIVDLGWCNAIYGDVTLNNSATLYNSGGYNVLNNGTGTTSFNDTSIFAPDVMSSPIQVNTLNVANTAVIRPWFSGNAPLTVDVSTDNGVTNSIPVAFYDSSNHGTFNALSPLDVGTAYSSESGPGALVVFLKSNKMDFANIPGTTNEHAVGQLLSSIVNASQNDSSKFSLENLPTVDGAAADILNANTLQCILQQVSYSGNLDALDVNGFIANAEMASNFNAQTNWSLQSFVNSILDNLSNGGNSMGNPNDFALNLSSTLNNAPMQLASLRQAMAPSMNRLNIDATNDYASSRGVWASYNGSHQSTEGDSTIGSSNWSSSSDGFTLGYTSGGDRFSWGLAVGHQKSTMNFSSANASGRQDGWNTGLYGSWKNKSMYLTGILGYGRYDNDTFGGLGGTSSNKNKATSISLEVGKHVSQSRTSELTPYASVLWTNIKQYDAQGGGGLPLTNSSNHVFTTELGFRYNHRMFDQSDKLKGGWQAGLAWLHQGGDNGLASTFNIAGSSLSIQSTPLASNSLVARLGVYGRIHNNLIGFAGYQGTFGNDQKINSVSAGVGYQF